MQLLESNHRMCKLNRLSLVTPSGAIRYGLSGGYGRTRYCFRFACPEYKLLKDHIQATPPPSPCLYHSGL